jgi:hypothetical protein
MTTKEARLTGSTTSFKQRYISGCVCGSFWVRCSSFLLSGCVALHSSFFRGAWLIVVTFFALYRYEAGFTAIPIDNCTRQWLELGSTTTTVGGSGRRVHFFAG